MTPWLGSSSTTRIRAASTNANLGFSFRRQVNAENGAFSDHTVELDGAEVVLGDLVADRQAETSPFADFFGREKWFEYTSAIRFFDTATGIVHSKADPFGGFVIECRNVQVAARRHAIRRIVCEIHDHLGDFVFV